MNEKNWYLTYQFFLRKWQILLKKINLIFNVKILIDLQINTNNHLRLTIKFNANVEIIPCQPFGTYRHFVHCAQ
jgi:hypothetical protein